MRMVDIIAKKRHSQKLSNEEINFFVEAYTKGDIPDYQASALCMAICFAGMDAEETAALTMAMASSGDMVDLSDIDGIKVDKHSTGGVGDKTTLIAAPIVASLGIPVAKMSGRGLGHTGGTIDKLESIPEYKVNLTGEEFINIVKTAGISVTGQSGNLAAADKKLYALRDVTATVDSIPLIAASIMSKKIAAGADAIVLDVKMGSGAFVKTIEDARLLAKEMVAIGKNVGRDTVAVITDMDVPLGKNIGNSLEVIEAIDVLSGHGPSDLTEICLELAANMLVLAKKGEIEDCRKMAESALKNGTALAKLRELVAAQGGDAEYIDNPEKFPKAAVCYDFLADDDGFIVHMDAEQIGVASMLLGAGRKEKNDTIDYSAGIVLQRKTGEAVHKGDVIAKFYTNNGDINASEKAMREAIAICKEKPQSKPLVYDVVRL